MRKTRRTAIRMVRTTLRAVEMAKYGRLNLETAAFHRLLLGPETWRTINKIPDPVSAKSDHRRRVVEK